MSNYRMTLIVGGREINIPVLPAKLNVSSPGKNERVTVLDLGEVLLLRKKGLRVLSWESFFPADSAPYTTGQVRDPISNPESQGQQDTGPLPDNRNRPGLQYSNGNRILRI